MFRRIIALSIVALIAAGAGVAGDKPWYSEDCAMCSNMMTEPDLMKNMKWEQYTISNGIVSITTVEAGHLDDYREAHEAMNKTAMRLMNGEMMELCGSCTAFGSCVMKGAKQEYVETSTGDVWIVMADDPEVVADLQNWVKRNKKEMKKVKSTKG